MTEKHILRGYDESLDRLWAQLLSMGKIASDMVESGGRVFLDQDAEGAIEVIARDVEVDQLNDAIAAGVVDVLSRYYPVARDLREVRAVEHIASNLERVADHGKGIAKRVIGSPQRTRQSGTETLLRQLHVAVMESLQNVLKALEQRNTQMAETVRLGDDQLDRIYDDLFHVVIADLQAAPELALGEVQALFVGKRLERIGDHATNIAEEVRYLIQGDRMSSTRPHGERRSEEL